MCVIVIYVRTIIRTYVRMHACVIFRHKPEHEISTSSCMNVCMYDLCMYEWSVCMNDRTYVRMYVCVYSDKNLNKIYILIDSCSIYQLCFFKWHYYKRRLHIHTHTYIWMYIYIYTYITHIYIHIYIYIYIYNTYILIHTRKCENVSCLCIRSNGTTISVTCTHIKYTCMYIYTSSIHA